MEHLCATLHELLRKFINENFDCNVSKASRELNLYYHRARDIYNGTIKSVTFMDALLIFQAVGFDGESILSENFPVEYSAYRKSPVVEAPNETERLLKFVFASDRRTELFNYVCAFDRDESDIHRAFGEFGSITLTEMVKNKVLEIGENGAIISRLGKDFAVSASTSRDHAERNFASLDPETTGTVFAAPVAGLNRLGLQRGYKAAFEFYKAINSIAEDPECKGSIVVVGSIAFGPLASAFRKEENYE